ncbi:hypothetical protein FZEAL_3674 [Fusarium zealandicum]|uniref:Zonadhesin n=1 Tax=Fusarium zealandicum TaxID=1053134 RepID=A0A8H4UNB4_9HYPO|nr:hypothetical protein FZEAL_3674 [Fusarium zealandicum]
MYTNQAGVDASAYGSNARYEPQATDDTSWDHIAPEFPSAQRKKANYRPTPLRWYFIVLQIAFILGVMGLVVWADQLMPNSDGTAKIINKRSADKPAEPRDVELEARQQDEHAARLSTTLIVSEFSKVITVPGTTGKFTTAVKTTNYNTFWDLTTSVKDGSTYTSAIVTVVPTVIEVEPTQADETYETVVVGTTTGYTMVDASGTANTPVRYSSDFTREFTITKTITIPNAATGPVETVTTDITRTIVSTIVEDGVTKTISSLVTEAVTSTVQSVGETTAAASIYVSYGRITITSVYTDPNQPQKPMDKPNPTIKPSEKVIDVVSVKPDQTVKTVQKLDPVTYVTEVKDVETKVVPVNPAAETVVSKVEAFETTVEELATGVDGVVMTNKVLSTVGASLATIVKPAQAMTVVSQIEAYETTIEQVFTGEDGVLTTDKVVSTVGASLATVVKPAGAMTVVTEAEAYETTVEVVSTGLDGKLTTNKALSTFGASLATVVKAAGAMTIVTSVEAYETTIEQISTGLDGKPTTNKVVSTVSGSLETIVKPAKLTTIVTTKSSGKLKTITSDRTESSTLISTIKGTTKTVAKTTTIMPTATDGSISEETGESDSSVKTVITVYELDAGKYFVGKFLPPILAVMLSIPARIIDHNAHLYQPFYAMNRPNGALGPQSMNLHFSGWTGFIQPFNVLVEGHPIPFISMLIVWCGALITPTAVEAIGFKMHGECKINAFEGCAPALGVSPQPTHILLALLGLSIVLLCGLLYLLRNRETGLYANPWSVAGNASLASNPDIRPRKASENKIAKEMAEKRYGFGYFENRMGQTEYGIVLLNDEGETLRQQDRPLSETSSLDSRTPTNVKTRKRNPFMVLGLAWRLVFLLFLLGLMVFLLYYHLTLDKQSGFKTFMNSQTFGVRFLFAAFGVIISFSWTAFFISIAMVVPYQIMSYSPQSASNSVLLTRPTNGVSGLWSALKHGQLFPALVALMTILSEFMPILLANIPYSLSQVRISHDICVRISVGILALMALTIMISFIIRWPDMPVDPRSVAGAMYYVSESVMVDHFSGMASMDNKQREQRIRELGGTYLYGKLTTRTGEKRPAVEWDDRTIGIIPAMPQHVKNDVYVRNESVDTTYHGYELGQDEMHNGGHNGAHNGGSVYM